MFLTIQQGIPDSERKDLVVSFAKHFVDADFNGLREILSEDVYIIIFNSMRKDGIETVLEYFKDWQKRAEDAFDCEVRWSPQFSHPELYFTSDKFRQAYIFGIDNSKITRILLTPRRLSTLGFSIDEPSYNVGFITANSHKEIDPLRHHYFCPVCGKDSEFLKWSEGIIFKDDSRQDRKIGLIVNASVCPDCDLVCEVSPDRKDNICFTMTREQQERGDALMSDEEKSEYVNNLSFASSTC